ncbi:hypothetical protein ONZ45_g8174 [Pleurotus djamor]|nr:hypothetical protein ONZ45_g8174 [Pleurotus djamor]
MRSQFLYGLEVLATALQASALQMPLGRIASSRRKRSLSSREIDISSLRHATSFYNDDDVSYSVNITLGSQEYSVIVDTGSTDLWILEPEGNFVTVNTTTVTANITYAKGSVSGPINYAEMSMAGITIPSQAFISVVESAELTKDETGLMGLGFMPYSPIANALYLAYGKENLLQLSRSPIHNVFIQDPSLPTFFTMLLGRIDDPDDVQHGALTIGEYVSQYASIEHSPRLPNLRPDHWAVLVDGIRVGNRSLPLNSSVPSAPEGKAVAILDSGFSLPPLPLYIIDSIYESIPGALRVPDIPEHDLHGRWMIPCDYAIDLSITIGGIEFPVNPLDLMIGSAITIQDTGERFSYCVNSFEDAASSLGPNFAGQTDMILGAAFLRNAYAAYHYGSFNSSGEYNEIPFVQLLPTTNAEEAHREFPSVRAAQIAQLNATVISPADLLSKLLPGPKNTTANSGDKKSDADAHPVRGVLAAQDDNENSTLSDFVSKFGPVIVGLLAGNVFLLIVVCSIAVYMCVTRSGKPPSTRTLPTTYQPLHLGGASEKQQLEPVFAGRYDA